MVHERRASQSGATLPEERQQRIRQRLEQDGRVLAAVLALEFETSEDTIRRDLRELAEAGHCKRVYGGALRLSAASGDFGRRATEEPARKAALGMAAAAFARRGQLVLVDTGSTNVAIARALPDGISVLTNCPAVAYVLMDRSGIDTTLLGGPLSRRTGGTLGLATLREVETHRPDICFLGACGVDAEHGLFAFEPEDARLKRAMIAASGETIVAVTNAKAGAAARHIVAPLSPAIQLVLEADAAVGVKAMLKRAGARIALAQPVRA